MYKLQDISLTKYIGNECTRDLYYRGTKEIFENEKGNSVILEGSFFELFTYFNSLSVEKWLKYTYSEKFYLVLDIEGTFKIRLFGHYVEENGAIKKEFLGSYTYSVDKRKQIVIPFPINLNSSVVAFSIETFSEVILYQSYYAADLEKEEERKPYIALVTTTFKKEKFIRKNITILKNKLFGNKDYGEHFCWNIIDNGSSLEECDDGKIRIIHNRNVGGAGGFTKGMIVSLRQAEKPTHILLMDDDVNVSVESFKRLYKLLNILRPEYVDYFVSGAMLNMDAPSIQHENTGVLVEEGYCKPVNSGFDMNLWDKVVLNEAINDRVEYQYAAWWFCCIPTTVASLDNLPLPLFVRGDDMEYSLRNGAKFITMNGISIWHQGFVGKFNPVMDYYQSKRNELIVFTSNPSLAKIDSFSCIEELFWQELYKFDYIGAEMLVDAVEDFMKGPDWFSSVDLFAQIQEKRKKDIKHKKITNELRCLINYDTLYAHEKTNRIEKFIYDYSYNGQAYIPKVFMKKKVGIIPYGWGYYPEKQMLTEVNYAIDPVHDTYVEYKKDYKKFRILKARFEEVRKKYMSQKDVLAKQYQDNVACISNVEFWDKYLAN